MKAVSFMVLALLVLGACNNNKNSGMATTNDSTSFKSGYANVNGLNMYYEIYGQGKPLVLIHGGGSTIGTSFGRVIPQFAKHRQVIAVELQAHGRTSDRNADLSFEQDADDVVALLEVLDIAKADFFGFSNGGTTAFQIALRHPGIVRKIVLGSALLKRNGVPGQFWDFMKQARLEQMPQQLQDAYKEVAPDTAGLQIMHDRDAKRMVNFKDIADEDIKSVKAPALIIIGDKDVITVAHGADMQKLLPHAQLLVAPGAHGAYIGEITTLTPGYRENDFATTAIEKFLDE